MSDTQFKTIFLDEHHLIHFSCSPCISNENTIYDSVPSVSAKTLIELQLINADLLDVKFFLLTFLPY